MKKSLFGVLGKISVVVIDGDDAEIAAQSLHLLLDAAAQLAVA